MSGTTLNRRHFLERVLVTGAACTTLHAGADGNRSQQEDGMAESGCKKLTEKDIAWLRRAIELAGLATTPEYGANNPFGAVLVLGDGRVLEGWNHTRSDNDPTGHAELWLIRHTVSSLNLDWRGADRPMLARATLYASSEPCAMCAGAAYWMGIGRVVFGCSLACIYGVMKGVKPDLEDVGLGISAGDVLKTSGRPIEVIGPCLEDEARKAHAAYWPKILG